MMGMTWSTALECLKSAKYNELISTIESGLYSCKETDEYGSNLIHIAVGLISESQISNFEALLRAFIKHCGNINTVNKQGQTPLDIANSWDRQLHANVLRKLEAKTALEQGKNRPLYIGDSIIKPSNSAKDDFGSAEVLPEYQQTLEDIDTVIEREATVSLVEGQISISRILQQSSTAVGILGEAGTGIGTAVLIHDSWIITARHCLDERRPESLEVCFPKAAKIVQVLGVIEEDAAQEYDYIILKITNNHGITPLKLSLDNTSSSLILIGQYGGALKTCTMENDSIGDLLLSGYQQTAEELSGSAYLNLQGEMCVLHMGASLHEKSGVFIKTIAETVQGSNIEQLIVDASACKDISVKRLEGPLPAFPPSTRWMEFDEGLKKRDFALGSTPELRKWSDTVIDVLFRFFIKEKAKLQLPKKAVINLESLNKQYNNNEKAVGKAIYKYIKDSNNDEYWHVYVWVKEKGTAKQAWVPLLNTTANRIEMGHKMPANCFWNHGAGKYLEERKKELTEKPKYKDNSKQLKGKMIALHKKYEKYQRSGIEDWLENNGQANLNGVTTEYIRQFMTESSNYSFQGKSYNASQGRSDKLLYGEYEAPNGYQWAHVQTGGKNKKYVLQPLDGMAIRSKNFKYLQNDIFTVKAKGQYVGVNTLDWIHDEEKEIPRIKTRFIDFLSPSTFKFKLRIDKGSLDVEKTEKLQSYLNKIKDSTGCTVKDNNGFFKISYQDNGQKPHKERIYDASEKCLEKLNKLMKP